MMISAVNACCRRIFDGEDKEGVLNMFAFAEVHCTLVITGFAKENKIQQPQALKMFQAFIKSQPLFEEVVGSFSK